MLRFTCRDPHVPSSLISVKQPLALLLPQSICVQHAAGDVAHALGSTAIRGATTNEDEEKTSTSDRTDIIQYLVVS